MDRLTLPLEGLADFLAFIFFFFLPWPPEADDAEATAATPPRPSCWIAAGFSTATGIRMIDLNIQQIHLALCLVVFFNWYVVMLTLHDMQPNIGGL